MTLEQHEKVNPFSHIKALYGYSCKQPIGCFKRLTNGKYLNVNTGQKVSYKSLKVL